MKRVVRIALLALAGAVVSWSPASAYLTDKASHAPSSYGSFNPPAKGGTYQDPVFGTEIRRLSDALRSSNNADGGSLTYVLGEYATMSAFNRDRSLFLLQHDSYFALYDGQGGYMGDLPWSVHASSEPRWSRTQTYVLYFVNGNQLKRYDAKSGAISVVRTFSEYGRITGNGESDIAFDGDRLVLAGDKRFIFTYDVATGTKSKVLDAGGRAFDSLYLTPAGNVTVTWIQSGTARYTGIELFDRNLVFQRQLTRAGGHMDVTRDNDGSEVLVWASSADPAPICDNGVVKVRMSDAKQTCLTPLDWSLGIHVSCADGDGSCIVSTYAPADPSPSGSWPAYTNEVLQVSLDASQVRRLAHHRSRPHNGYNYMPKATVSRDGRRVVYGSNFNLQATAGAPSEYSDAYLMTVPAASTSGGGGGDAGGDTTGGDSGGGDTSGGTTGGDTTASGTRFEETASAVTFTGNWHDNGTAGHSGGTAKLAVDPGSRARFSFQGTGARWIGYRDEWSGIARVYVDGKLAKTVDTYASPSGAQKELFVVTGLASGAHTLEVEVTGSAGSSSGGSWVWVDAFEALTSSSGTDTSGSTGDGTSTTTKTFVDEVSPRITSTGTWHTNDTAKHRGGTAALSMDRDSRVRLTFEGTGIRWIGYRDKWSGIAEVYVDGKIMRRVNTYSSKPVAGRVVFQANDLSPGKHTIEIRVLGRRSRESQGSWVWVDGFVVVDGKASP